MEIVAALFVEAIDFRQVAGPATRIDITGAFFSTAVAAYPAQLTPHLVVLVRAAAGTDGNATLETVFVRDDGEEIGRNRQAFFGRAGQVRIPAGEGRARVPRARARSRRAARSSRAARRSRSRSPRSRLRLKRVRAQPDPVGRRPSERMDLVNRYASALSLHPTPVEAVGEVAGEILEQFDGVRPDLLVCFASPHHAGAFEDVLGGLRKLLEPEAAIGCTMVGVAGGGVEVEDGPGLSVFAASFGAGRVDAIALETRADRRRLRDRRLARLGSGARARC